jgi:hypothetical protein
MTQIAKREKPRLIQGVILKCVDGRWADGDGLTPPAEMLVIGSDRVLRCWGADNDLLDYEVEQPGEPLPDVDELNAKIPEEEWGSDLNNEPRPPWERCVRAFLLDPEKANVYTFLNSTVGARIAVERLEDRIKWKRAIRGANVVPVVKLDSRPMKTKKAGVTKQRPEFTVIDFREFSGAKLAFPQIEHQKAEGEALRARLQDANNTGDREGFRDGIVEETLEAPTEKKAKTGVGKPVKPTTIAEEIDDGLPGDLAPPINPLKMG